MRRTVRATLVVALALGVLLAPTRAAEAGGFVLVRAARNPAAKLSRDTVKGMFSGRVTTWGSGEPVTLVIGGEDAPAMAWIAATFFGVSAKTLLTKIKQQVFRGEMPHPLSAEDDAATIERVAGHPNALGAVSDAAAKGLPKDVAVIAVVD